MRYRPTRDTRENLDPDRFGSSSTVTKRTRQYERPRHRAQGVFFVCKKPGGKILRTLNAWRRMALVAVGLVAAASMSGCISSAHFVDGSLKDVDTSQFQKP